MKQKTQDSLVDLVKALAAPMEPEPTGQAPRLQALNEVKALAFDVYGTLFQSGVGDIALASKAPGNREDLIRDAFSEAGFTLLDDGVNPLAELFADTLHAHQDIRRGDDVAHPEVDIFSVWEDYLDQLSAFEIFRGGVSPEKIRLLAVQYEFRVNPVWPMPGALDLLDTLRGRAMPLSIISNAQFFTRLLFPALFDGELEELGFIPDACVWSYELMRAKPSLSLFETAAEFYEAKLGLKPENVLFLGNDMLNDMLPASQLGMRTALFAGDKRSLRLREDVADCKGVKPDLVLTEMNQLLECLTG